MASKKATKAAKAQLLEQWSDHPEFNGAGIGGKEGNYLVRVYILNEVPDDFPTSVEVDDEVVDVERVVTGEIRAL